MSTKSITKLTSDFVETWAQEQAQKKRIMYAIVRLGASGTTAKEVYGILTGEEKLPSPSRLPLSSEALKATAQYFKGESERGIPIYNFVYLVHQFNSALANWMKGATDQQLPADQRKALTNWTSLVKDVNPKLWESYNDMYVSESPGYENIAPNTVEEGSTAKQRESLDTDFSSVAPSAAQSRQASADPEGAAHDVKAVPVPKEASPQPIRPPSVKRVDFSELAREISLDGRDEPATGRSPSAPVHVFEKKRKSRERNATKETIMKLKEEAYEGEEHHTTDAIRNVRETEHRTWSDYVNRIRQQTETVGKAPTLAHTAGEMKPNIKKEAVKAKHVDVVQSAVTNDTSRRNTKIPVMLSPWSGRDKIREINAKFHHHK